MTLPTKLQIDIRETLAIGLYYQGEEQRMDSILWAGKLSGWQFAPPDMQLEFRKRAEGLIVAVLDEFALSTQPGDRICRD